MDLLDPDEEDLSEAERDALLEDTDVLMEDTASVESGVDPSAPTPPSVSPIPEGDLEALGLEDGTTTAGLEAAAMAAAATASGSRADSPPLE